MTKIRKKLPLPQRGEIKPKDLPLTNSTAQGLTAAMFAAALEECQCRPCRILRKVLTQMSEQYLSEEVE